MTITTKPSSPPGDLNLAVASTISRDDILRSLKETLGQEASAIEAAVQHVSQSDVDVVQAILACRGKVVISGLGKSGLVGRKIAATLTSTGTPAVFLHSAEALHGDLGIVQAEDIVWAISKGGEQAEFDAMLPALRRIGARIIAMTANRNSTLGKAADWVLHLPMEREACPHDLAPTVSSTLALALGDSVAMAAMRARQFKSEDFALFHPGGKLGKRLLLRVSDVMVPLDRCPLLASNTDFEQMLNALTKYGIGMVMFGQGQQLHGILTDGDIRRLLAREKQGVFAITASQCMTSNPFTVQAEQRAFEALESLESRPSPFNVAPVLDATGAVVGAIRLHDLLAAG